jgi:predicted NBD/HSP70 family sugar kinase
MVYMNYIEVAQGVNPKFQNKINQSVVFNYLRHTGPAHKSKIAEDLNLSIPAISRAVDSLVKREFLEEVDHQKSAAGRNVSFYRASVRHGFVIGVDLLKHAIVAQSLAFENEASYFSFEPDGTPIAEVLEREIGKIMQNLPAQEGSSPAKNLKAIGIGSPGIVDVGSGDIKTAVFHKEYEGVNLKKPLEKAFRKPVFVDNVVNLSAFAEFQNLKGKKIENLLCLDIGFEIGAGLVVGGKVFRGRHCTVGEVGFMASEFQADDEPKRIFAQSHSFIWLCAQAAERLGWQSSYEDYSKKDENLVIVHHLFEAANQGESKATGIVRAYLQKLALLIINIQLMMDPDEVVIGGDICLMPGIADFALPYLREQLKCISRFAPPILQFSGYGNQSALRGACDWAVETFFANEFPYVMH